jgi:hypothetical protein
MPLRGFEPRPKKKGIFKFNIKKGKNSSKGNELTRQDWMKDEFLSQDRPQQAKYKIQQRTYSYSLLLYCQAECEPYLEAFLFF